MEDKADKQEQKDLLQKENLEYHTQTQFMKESLSPYLEAYWQFFKESKDKQIQMDVYLENLFKHKINYNNNKFFAQPSIGFLYQSQDCSVVTLSVSLSYFNFEISILNRLQYSITDRCLQRLGCGGMGSVYLYPESEEKCFAIKKIQYCYNGELDFLKCTNNQQQQKNIRSAIVQCCFNKLFSALKIGPYYQSPLGFDLVIYNSSVQMSIELCKEPENTNNFSDLGQSLRLMHHLKIIHGDIKPENVMWSSKYNKLVFIDFGLSQALSQEIGQLTYTAYFGSYYYTVKEMKHIFTNKNTGFVDLYYNDVYALLTWKNQEEEIKLIKPINISETTNEVSKLNQTQQEYRDLISNLYIIFLIFHRDSREVQQVIKNRKILSISDQVLQVLFQLPQSKESHQIIKCTKCYEYLLYIYIRYTIYYLNHFFWQLCLHAGDVSQNY